MARVEVSGQHIRVRMNVVEKAMALHRSQNVPLAAVVDVHVALHPRASPLMRQVRMGWASAGAPGRNIATVGPRARFGDGQALLVIWLNRPSLVVQLGPHAGPWRLVVVSTSHAAELAEEIDRLTR